MLLEAITARLTALLIKDPDWKAEVETAIDRLKESGMLDQEPQPSSPSAAAKALVQDNPAMRDNPPMLLPDDLPGIETAGELITQLLPTEDR